MTPGIGSQSSVMNYCAVACSSFPAGHKVVPAAVVQKSLGKARLVMAGFGDHMIDEVMAASSMISRRSLLQGQ